MKTKQMISDFDKANVTLKQFEILALISIMICVWRVSVFYVPHVL